jgi:hypothetical protein
MAIATLTQEPRPDVVDIPVAVLEIRPAPQRAILLRRTPEPDGVTVELRFPELGGRYGTYCQAHGGAARWPTLVEALANLAIPIRWCPGCDEALEHATTRWALTDRGRAYLAGQQGNTASVLSSPGEHSTAAPRGRPTSRLLDLLRAQDAAEEAAGKSINSLDSQPEQEAEQARRDHLQAGRYQDLAAWAETAHWGA